MTEPRRCLNCDEPLGASLPRYCPQCGQETTLRPPTLGEFAQQFGGAYISTEGALWRSLKLLLTRPGAITREYLDGRRKRYVLPLRLYLTISVIVLLAMRWAGGAEVRVVLSEEALRKDPSIELSMFGGRAGLHDGAFFCRDLPDWFCTRLKRRFDASAPAVAGEVNAASERLMANLGTAMFLLVPAFAAGLMLLYRGRGMRYTEHLVFALHLHAFGFLMLGLSLLPFQVLAVAAAVATAAYALLAMHRVYGGRWGPLLLRAFALGTSYALLVGLAMSALGIWAMLT